MLSVPSGLLGPGGAGRTVTGTIKVCFVKRKKNKTPFASCDEVFPLQKEFDWLSRKRVHRSRVVDLMGA